MQVSLDPIEWKKLTAYENAASFFEAFYEDEVDVSLEHVSASDYGWLSDSAMEYNDVAEALEHILKFVDEEAKKKLEDGALKVIAISGHIDEFETSPASDYCYWLSCSPEKAKTILENIKSTKWEYICNLLTEYPPQFNEIGNDPVKLFMPMIQQHIKVIEYAVNNNYGLLGHCG